MTGLKSRVMNFLKEFLSRYDYEVINRASLYEWQLPEHGNHIPKNSLLPDGAEDYLRADNPRLKELQEKYSLCDKNVTTPLVWTENKIRPDEIKFFRSDNAYVWQLRGKDMNVMSYSFTAYYIKSIDKMGLLDKLIEDNYFGNVSFTADNKIISRDLIDSIIEIYFLEKHLSLSSTSDFKILDIGAGYGRLAYRMLSALPNLNSYFCTDAFAVSTFLSEYYLKFRKLDDRAHVIPLYEIEKTLENNKIDLAINIHSFSECKISAIEWWLSLLEKNKVSYLMVVPNVVKKESDALLTNDGIDFQPVIENHGYKLIAKEPKYRDPVVQQFAANPAYHYLFKLDMK
jgi:hypothetical protein